MDTWIYPALLGPVGLVVMWVLVTWMLGHFSGWASLAEAYRGALAQTEAVTPMASGYMSRFGIPVSFGNVLNVATGPEGVQLSMFPLFAIASPKLLIPWGHMAECSTYQRFGLFDRFEFRPALCNVRITLVGRAARFLRDESTRRGYLAAAVA